jgi:glutaredoxin 3
MANLELYGTARCPYTQELRDWLEWLGHDFVEFDVESDLDARHRMCELSHGRRNVPLLVEDSKVVHVGWQGCTCRIDAD